MNMKPLSTALVLALAASGAVKAADTITFDPDGSGPEGTIQVGAFDWTPDNAISVDSSPLETGDIFDAYTQASLGNFLDPDSNVIAGTGLNTDYEITFQAGFTEFTALSIETLGVGTNANFLLADAADQNVNFFNIYWDDLGTGTASNPETGEGYGDGTLIMTAVLTEQATTFFTPYTQDLCTGSCADGIFVPDGTNDTATLSALDQSADGDDQPGVGTVEGSGGGTLDAEVTGQNSDFFLDPLQQLIIALFFNSSQVTPFLEVDPTGPITCTAGIVGNCPDLAVSTVAGFDLVNGIFPVLGCESGAETGCDFIFQADANQSFEAIAVPEPSIIALLGLGLGALGFARRRRQ